MFTCRSTSHVTALEATQRQMDGFLGQLRKCLLKGVASVADCLKICPQLDSRVERGSVHCRVRARPPIQGYLARKKHTATGVPRSEETYRYRGTSLVRNIPLQGVPRS